MLSHTPLALRSQLCLHSLQERQLTISHIAIKMIKMINMIKSSYAKAEEGRENASVLFLIGKKKEKFPVLKTQNSVFLGINFTLNVKNTINTTYYMKIQYIHYAQHFQILFLFKELCCHS